MNAEVLEGALDDIGVRLDIADAGRPRSAPRMESGGASYSASKFAMPEPFLPLTLLKTVTTGPLFRGRRGIDISGRIYLAPPPVRPQRR